jgi:fructokinase
MRKTVLSVGETLWDLLPTGAVLGGAPFNFAYRVNSLGDRGLIASRLGEDELGARALARARELGMETEFIQSDAVHPTGTVEITLDEARQPSYFIVPGVAYDHMETTPALLEAARASDCICFGTLVQRSPTTRETVERMLDAAAGVTKLLDINLRKDCYTPETVRSSLERADALKLNEDEAREVGRMLDLPSRTTPEFCRAIIEAWGLAHCVVTFGERGAFAASREGEAAYSPGYRVALVDPCGSGDAFTAGFVHGLLRGAPLAECLELGNAFGAIVATQEGATAPVTPSEIKEFMRGEHERITEEGLAG